MKIVFVSFIIFFPKSFHFRSSDGLGIVLVALVC